MPALVAGIHVLAAEKGVDGRDKPGHDGLIRCSFNEELGFDLDRRSVRFTGRAGA
jgi:hypothetical protein